MVCIIEGAGSIARIACQQHSNDIHRLRPLLGRHVFHAAPVAAGVAHRIQPTTCPTAQKVGLVTTQDC